MYNSYHNFTYEFYDIKPDWKFHNSENNIQELLLKFSSVLQFEDEAIKNSFKIESKMDIVDEWYDKADLSFIHQILAVRKDFKEKDFIDIILHAMNNRENKVDEIAKKEMY